MQNSITCTVCGGAFFPTIDLHYISRDRVEQGLATIARCMEPKIYDTFDCPNCGCQVFKRERNYTREVILDDGVLEVGDSETDDPQENKTSDWHDGCKGCANEHKDFSELPCVGCKQNYNDFYTIPKEEEHE